MYAAISGLKAHMTKLNVLGNNIANVNTVGYKSQRAIFADSLYTTTTSGSNGTNTAGGRNPSQIGYGVQLSTIDVDMGTGTYSPTGRPLDCMISGQGFFLVGDKTVANTVDPTDPESLKAFQLTRVGNFEFKGDGYLAKEDSDAVVYGFMCIGTVNGEPIFSDQLVPIRYPKMEKVTTVDANGKTVETVQVRYPVAKPGAALSDATAADGSELSDVNIDNVTIDPSTGRITGTVPDTGEMITIGVIALGNVTNPNGVTHLNGSYYKAGDGAGKLQVATMGGISENMYVSNTNPTAADTDLTKYQKGLSNVNGSMLPAGGTAARGMGVLESNSSLQTSGLEASKTDLATEISEMITTQRGYQANTRIITVTDSMLEELVNIKR
ncbi:MAG: flagellar hook-basal body complex protein [Dorea sp.]|nr:flagellar hook-basal body complex protein [Dorea sp.]